MTAKNSWKSEWSQGRNENITGGHPGVDPNILDTVASLIFDLSTPFGLMVCQVWQHKRESRHLEYVSNNMVIVGLHGRCPCQQLLRTFCGVVHGKCEQELLVAIPEIHYSEQAEYSWGADSLLGNQPMGLTASSWAVKPVFS